MNCRRVTEESLTHYMSLGYSTSEGSPDLQGRAARWVAAQTSAFYSVWFLQPKATHVCTAANATQLSPQSTRVNLELSGIPVHEIICSMVNNKHGRFPTKIFKVICNIKLLMFMISIYVHLSLLEGTLQSQLQLQDLTCSIFWELEPFPISY